jgi:hypothetical protein
MTNKQPPDSTDDRIATWRSDRQNPKVLTGGAVELPHVPLDAFPRINRDLSTWDEPQLDPLTHPPDLSGLENEEAVEVIREWFLANFEDPAHHTPYISAEGGYQYIWGGPYDARDVMGDVFGEQASEDLIEAAVTEIERDGITDWAPTDSRRQPPEDDITDETIADPHSLHARMLRRIEALEETLGQLAPHHPGIGHNHPPETIEPVPFEDADLQAIRNAVATLKEQPAEPATAITAYRAGAQLKAIGERLRDYVIRQGHTFIDEAVKAAGQEFGKRVVQAPFWCILAQQLISVSQAVVDWIHSLGLPF